MARPPSIPPPKSSLDRCMAMLEVRRILSDLWIHAADDYERQEIEQALVVVRRLLVRLCKDHDIPLG
jgi:hypothetical protein